MFGFHVSHSLKRLVSFFGCVFVCVLGGGYEVHNRHCNVKTVITVT